MFIVCQGNMEGLLMQREVGVAQRRHLRSSWYWRGFDGKQKLSSEMAGWLCEVLVVRPVWPGLALPLELGAAGFGAGQSLAIGIHAKGTQSRVTRFSVIGGVTEQKEEGKVTLGIYKQ